MDFTNFIIIIIFLVFFIIILLIVIKNPHIRKVWLRIGRFIDSGVETHKTNEVGKIFDFSGRIKAEEVLILKNKNKGIIEIIDENKIIVTINNVEWENINLSTIAYLKHRKLRPEEELLQEIPSVNVKKFYLTRKGFEKIKKEYQILRNLRTVETEKEAFKILESENVNPKYLYFWKNLNFLKKRLSELENILKNIEIISLPSERDKNIINLGATVKVFIDDHNIIDKFTIVGTLEANPSVGKISNESPVGKILIGKMIGDVATINYPIKTDYKIINLYYDKNLLT